MQQRSTLLCRPRGVSLTSSPYFCLSMHARRHARRNAHGVCMSIFPCNRRPCRLCSRRRATPRVPGTRAPRGLAWRSAGAVRPPLPPPPLRVLGVSCRALSPGEGRLGRAPPQALTTGERTARASDDGAVTFCYVQQYKVWCSTRYTSAAFHSSRRRRTRGREGVHRSDVKRY